MIKIRYVIDTNIFISRLLLPNSIPAQVVRYLLDSGHIVVSDETLEELSNILMRNKFDKYVSLEARKLFIEGLKALSIKVTVDRTIRVCRDPKDNKILEAAVSGEARMIITGDKDLLVLGKYEGIEIITPHDFYISISEG